MPRKTHKVPPRDHRQAPKRKQSRDPHNHLRAGPQPKKNPRRNR